MPSELNYGRIPVYLNANSYEMEKPPKDKKNQAICEGIRFLYSAITSVHEKVVIKCYQWTHGIK